jgi:iron complex outermembrane receptor protein
MRQIIIAFLLLYSISSAQPIKDTIRVYKLGEIVSETNKQGVNVQPTKIKEIKYHEIKEKDAISFEELSALIPSGFVQINSRGESIIYLRGAGERSIALFFDGVYFNIPWDNRLDLSMIPTDIIGDLKISTGANSVLYGANVLSGAVNITTTERENNGMGGNVALQIGDGGRKYGSIKLEGKKDNFNYMGNLSFLKVDGLKAPKDDDFSLRLGKSEDLLVNSYSERITAYMRGEYQFDEDSKLGLSFNHIDGQQGVIPENNPADIKTRFWQYPEWLRSIVTLNGEHRISDAINMRGAVWYDKFNQTIEDFSDIDYKDIDETQYDEDITVGLRVNLEADLSESDKLNFTINGINSKHREEIVDKDGNSGVKDFAQTTSSFGLEYKKYISDLVLTVGSSYDRFDISKAGDFTNAEGSSFDDISGILGASYKLSDNYNIFANVGKKSRFPTMRESFSAALNKFIVNPDLKPESGILSEVGIDYKGTDLTATLSLFANSYTDLIAQAKVPNDSLQRKQRVNMDEATIIGAELIARYYITSNLDISGNLTYMNSKGTVDGVEQELEYRPELMAFVQADWRFYDGFDVLAEVDMMGNQYGISDIAGGLVKVDPTTLLNLRLSYQTMYGTNLYTFYVRANNLLDQARLDKIGIAAPGRTLYGGVNLAF